MGSKIRKVTLRALSYFVLFLTKTKILRWPTVLNLVQYNNFAQKATLWVSVKKLQSFRRKNPTPSMSQSILNSPRLKFHSLYSYNRLEHPTPCATELVKDLASCVGLKNQKILALGARNTIELDQLVLYGAAEKNITAIDLYSSHPRILEMDFHDLKFDDATFDIIFWAGSFAYAENPRKAAAEALRVLKSSGYLAVGDTLVGNAKKERLKGRINNTKLEKQVSEALETAALTTSLFTHQIDTIDNLVSYFYSDGDALILTRIYEPTHANFIMKKNLS